MVQDSLFELIESLSKSEKRYFSINACREDSNHARLFKLLTSMKEFDEKKLKKVFPTNLSWEKGNLYKLILKVMRNYQSDKSAYLLIKELTMDAQFLIDRGLLEQSLVLLKKAKKLAVEYDRLSDLLEISRLLQICLTRTKPNGQKEILEKLIAERKKALELIEEETNYSINYLSLLTGYFQKITLSTKEEKQELLEKYPLVSLNIDDIQSNRGKFFLLLSKKYLAQLLGQSDEVYNLSKKIIGWWDENPKIKKEENLSYLASFSNLLGNALVSKQLEDVPQLISQLEQLKPENAIEEKYIFIDLLRRKLVYFMNIGAFLEAKTEFLKIEKTLFVIKNDNQFKTMIIMNFAIILFLLEDFQDCIRWINEILENKNAEKRQEIQQLARLLKCICSLEVENDTFESTCRATNHFFVEKKIKKDSFEFKILKHLRQIYTVPFDEKKEEYKKMEVLLETEKISPDGNISPGLDEFTFWIKSKLTRIPMVTLFSESINK